MALITISREYGSLGTTIGQNVAESLHYSYIDRTIIEAVLDKYGLAYFHNFYSSPHSFWDKLVSGNAEIMEFYNKTIRTISKKDNTVLVGRAGFVLLNSYENVFHVLIKAPFEKRVDNVMASEHISDRDKAAARVMQNDHARESFISTFYKANQNDAGWFDLVIDTGCITADVAERWIVEAAGLMERKHVDPEKSSLTFEADKILQATVEEVIADENYRKLERQQYSHDDPNRK